MSFTPLKLWNRFLGKTQNAQSSFNAIKTITTEHERIHSGRMFHHADVSSVAAAAADAILFSVSSDMELHLRSISYKSNVGPCEGYLYENPFKDVNSLGIGFLPENMNRGSNYTSVSSFYHNPFYDVNSLGTQIDAGAIVQSTGGSVKSIEGEAESAVTEWVLKKGSDYLFRFINNNGATALVKSSLSFYEPTSGDTL